MIAIVESVPIELIPDFDDFVEIWIALFGRSESRSVSGICCQFWQSDWVRGNARRAILDVARARFPVQPRPLIRLLRALSATGFLDTDPLVTANYSPHTGILDEEREMCTRYVFDFLAQLPTYTQVVPANASNGAQALYEKMPERHGSSSVAGGLIYTNLRALKLPGGTTLPPRTIGRLLSGDGGDAIAVSWQHEHSGWMLLLEFLTDYVNRKRRFTGTSNPHGDISFSQRGSHRPIPLRLEDIGAEMDREGDDAIVMDILDLIRSVVQDNPGLAAELLDTFESSDPVVAHTMVEAQPPDLVQLTTAVLEETLSRSSSQPRGAPRAPLITSAISVLAALLAQPHYSTRVWLYIRSTASLFGSEKSNGATSAVLTAERLTGQYTMTLALLHLVQQLFNEASTTVISVLQHTPKLQQIKEEVLLRAVRFVHAEIWVEHVGWKYAQLGDRFEIARRMSSLYTEVMLHAPPTLKEGPFTALSQILSEAFLAKATTSTITPLVSSLTGAGSVLGMLYAARRYGDARRLVYLMESHLRLTRVLLNFKPHLVSSTEPSLLEQALCAKVGGSVASFDGGPSKVDPVDALAGYVKDRSTGSSVPIEATRVLFALCSSLASTQGSPPTIIGHLSDPEATVASLVRIVQHPYDEPQLRHALWNFITLAVDKEPALARLFVTGHFREPMPKFSEKGKEKDTGGNDASKSRPTSAVTLACDMLQQWEELWDPNPELLASLLRFMDVVWEHAHEHKQHLEPICQDARLFEHLAAILGKELGPSPDYRTADYAEVDGAQRSDLHVAVSSYAYRTAVKCHAAHILSLDIRMHLQSHPDDKQSAKPASYKSIEAMLKSEDQLTKLVLEAATSSYDPSLHDELAKQINSDFPTLTLDHLRVHDPIVEREYGDNFAFSTALLQIRLQPYSFGDTAQGAVDAHKKLMSVNLNLSLTYVQTTLTESWQFLLLQLVTYLRGTASVRSTLLALAASISGLLSVEKRSGDMMGTIHHARLSLLLALLEVIWFSTSDTKEQVVSFISLVASVRGIILSASQPPGKSLLGQATVPFHRPLLQTIYFCARHSRILVRRPKALTAEQRLSVSMMLETTLLLVVDSLRFKFDTASLGLDIDLDQDLELLVAVFQQCTRLDLNPSPSLWLARCQETDVIRTSLHLFSRLDLVGLADVALLRMRKQPLYAPHVLAFHMALASVPLAAERLASEGILAAYSQNPITTAIRVGMIDVVLPEMPGERSPAHRAYCSMLAIIAGVVASLGRHGHFFYAEAAGLVQLYGDQIHRTLSWTVGEPLSSPLIEEMEQVVNLFNAIAQNAPGDIGSDAVKRALRSFTDDALLLLQQLNYSLTHPNHLASLFEPITAHERSQFDAENNNASVNTPAEVVDPLKRPFLARLVHRLFRLSGSILSTLSIIGGAETVLIGEKDDWPLHEALIVPVSFSGLFNYSSLTRGCSTQRWSLESLRQWVPCLS